MFYELGPGTAAEQLASALHEAAARHGLSIDDPLLAAEHLLSLVLSIPLNRAMLLGDEVHFTRQISTVTQTKVQMPS